MILLLVLLFAGCGGNSVEKCLEEATEISDDDTTFLGLTPTELTARHEGGINSTGLWSQGDLDGQEAQVTMSITGGQGQAIQHMREPNPRWEKQGDTAPVTPRCADYVTIPVSVRISTADGALDGTVQTELRCYEDREELEGELPIDGFSGDFAWSDDPASCETFTLPFRARFDPNDGEGSILSRCESDGALTRGVLSWDFAL